tara:strand:- start:28925 stop:33076 length:4152 start_codon:yes stop_codon:yes gene_type:complete
MAGKKRKKKEQTFNVYPYLGGYQHFMKGGGTLPEYEETGQVNINDVVRKIKPTNKYQYDRTFDGVREEWKNNVGNQGDRDKYNSLGGLGPMGLMANMFKGAGDLFGNVVGAFDKDNYTPGGKYSKFDADGALKYGRVNLTNTRDENALLHGENFAKYLGMSNKERKRLIESGDMRNSDLWWTPDELTHGKWNWMDRNEDGTAKFDGVNYRVSQKRSEHYRNPDQGSCSDPQYTNGADCEANGGVWTGDALFGIKTKNEDGTYTYFNEDGTVDYDKSTQTQYDIIEEGKGEGGLGDVNAQTMLFDFDKEGDNKLAGFTSFDEVTETTSSCSDGTSTTREQCEANSAVWTEGTPTTNVQLQQNKYDPDKIYGPHSETIVTEGETEQQRINREAKEKSEDDARYGRELRRFQVGGGATQDDQASGGRTADFETNFDVFENNFKTDYRYGGALRKFQDGEETEETIDEKEERMYKESLLQLPPSQSEMYFDNPVANFNKEYNDPTSAMNMPWAQPGSFGDPNKEIDLQPEPKSNWEEPSNINKLKNWFKGDSHLNKDPGPDYDNNAEFDASIAEKNEAHANNPRVLDPANRTDMEGAAKGFSCSDGVSTTREQCEGNGGVWNDPQDMGVDVSYGDGPIQSTWNKGKEFFNTGAVGAVTDIYGKASEFIVDKAAPFLEDIYNRNVQKQNEMFKRSVSAEDIAPVMEETAGTGSKGFYDVNKGGYGDSLYGTGKVFGQAQQGQELMEQQSDLSGVVNYMNPEVDFLKYKDEYLDKQKTYLGKMKNGAELPKAQVGLTQPGKIKKGGQWVWNGFKYVWEGLRPINPLAFDYGDNVLFSAKRTPSFTKINFNETPIGSDKSNTIGFLNLKNKRNAPSSVEMVSVLDEYRKTGIGTSLYDAAIRSTRGFGEKYPGVISGETLDNPEATVNIWKHYDFDVNEGGLRTNKFKNDPDFKPESILEPDYNFNTRVKLRGLNAIGREKVDETNRFYTELGKENSSIFNYTIDRVGGDWDIHSPTWRGIKSGFSGPGLRIGDGKKHNKLQYAGIPLTLGALTYWGLSSTDGLRNEEAKKKELLKKAATEAGYDDVLLYEKDLRDGKIKTGYKSEDDIYLKTKDSIDYGIYTKGGELRKFLRGGNTGSEGAVLCDAYDRPVGPTNEENSKADYSAPVLPYDDPDGKGTGPECAIPGTCPGMKWGGQLPTMNDGGNWNLKGWLKGEQGFIPDYKGESTKKTISENESVNKALDYTQTGLTVAGMQDYSGPIAAGADLLNSAISGTRAYAAPEGSEQRKVHTENAVLNATSAIPGYGLASATTSLAKDTAGYAGVMDTTKSVGTQVADAVTDKKAPLVTENMSSTKKVGTTAKYGGEQEAEIDMDLYYELMKAGANIQITG